MLVPLVALAFAAAPDPAALSRVLGAAPAGGARATSATALFVGVPYVASALGEGAGVDPDPRFRLDAFDCMTFVETAVALASARSLDEARRALDDVRYSGAPALAARNHEVLSQWIPANVAKGWIADVGPDVAGPLARVAGKTYSPETWAAVRAAGRGIVGLPRSRLPAGRFEAHVVAIADVPAVADRIPAGTVVFVVRADAPDRATRVTHAGLAVGVTGGRALVRHATSSRGVARVIEEPLDRFLARERRAYPLWPVEGLALYTIRDNATRVRALGGAAIPAPPPAGRTAPAPAPADAAHPGRSPGEAPAEQPRDERRVDPAAPPAPEASPPRPPARL